MIPLQPPTCPPIPPTPGPPLLNFNDPFRYVLGAKGNKKGSTWLLKTKMGLKFQVKITLKPAASSHGVSIAALIAVMSTIYSL